MATCRLVSRAGPDLMEISVDVEHELHRAVAGGDLGTDGDRAADVEREHGVVRPRLAGRRPVDVADLRDAAGPDGHEPRAAAAGDRDVGRDGLGPGRDPALPRPDETALHGAGEHRAAG